MTLDASPFDDWVLHGARWIAKSSTPYGFCNQVYQTQADSQNSATIATMQQHHGVVPFPFRLSPLIHLMCLLSYLFGRSHCLLSSQVPSTGSPDNPGTSTMPKAAKRHALKSLCLDCLSHPDPDPPPYLTLSTSPSPPYPQSAPRSDGKRPVQVHLAHPYLRPHPHPLVITVTVVVLPSS